MVGQSIWIHFWIMSKIVFSKKTRCNQQSVVWTRSFLLKAHAHWADSVTCVCNYLLLLRYDTLCEYIIIIIARDLAWLTLRFWLQKRSFWHWDCKVRWINTKIVWLMRLKFSLQSRSLDIETAKWVNVINGFDSNSHSKIPFLTLTSLLHRFQIWRFETERTHGNNSMNV